MFLIVGYYLFSAISIPLDLMLRFQPIKFYLKPNQTNNYQLHISEIEQIKMLVTPS
jgi:hypothetical protein